MAGAAGSRHRAEEEQGRDSGGEREECRGLDFAFASRFIGDTRDGTIVLNANERNALPFCPSLLLELVYRFQFSLAHTPPVEIYVAVDFSLQL
jgi:hypothetical protein